MFNSVFYQFRCWSFVGDDKKGQNVSIGERCDTKAIVEHELLHALGFYHEQSRSDRDDYVKIWWDQIEEGGSKLFHLCFIQGQNVINTKVISLKSTRRTPP